MQQTSKPGTLPENQTLQRYRVGFNEWTRVTGEFDASSDAEAIAIAQHKYETHGRDRFVPQEYGTSHWACQCLGSKVEG